MYQVWVKSVSRNENLLWAGVRFMGRGEDEEGKKECAGVRHDTGMLAGGADGAMR